MHRDDLAVPMQGSDISCERSAEQQSDCAASAASSPVTPSQAALPLTSALAVSSSEVRLSPQVLLQCSMHAYTMLLRSAAYVSMERMLTAWIGECRAAVPDQTTRKLTLKSPTAMRSYLLQLPLHPA